MYRVRGVCSVAFLLVLICGLIFSGVSAEEVTDPVNSSGLVNETVTQSETSSVTTTTAEPTAEPTVTETETLTPATTEPAAEVMVTETTVNPITLTEPTITETVQPEETEVAAANGVAAPALTDKTCSAISSGSGNTCRSSLTRYPLMHPSKAELDAEKAEFETMEKYTAPVKFRSLTAEGEDIVTSKSLLPYISYVPAERNQGYCGNCWVWASTGALEVEHTVDTGVNERLSIQYFNSKYNNGEAENWACCGGNIQIFTSWYDSDLSPIPWSNTNAGYGDYYSECEDTTAIPIGTISTDRHYGLNSISYSAVATNGSGIDQSTAIANIKSAIDNNKAMYYGFTYGDSGWDDFMYTFWAAQDESAIFDPTSHNGEESAGGHGVLLVGYNTTDRYWLALNSWGTTSGRPNGLFRLKMDIDYDSYFTYTEGEVTHIYYPQHRFYILDSTFKPTITSITPSSGVNSGPVIITNLAGTGFSGTPTVKLNRTGYSDIAATDVTVVDPTNITCTFPITNMPAGQYNVVVINPDGLEAVLDDGFTIKEPSTEVGVYRQSTHTFYLRPSDWPTTPVTTINWGLSTDLPVTGDWNGDGTTEVGIYRPSTHTFYLRPANWPTTPVTTINWGLSTDLPVTGYW